MIDIESNFHCMSSKIRVRKNIISGPSTVKRQKCWKKKNSQNGKYKSLSKWRPTNKDDFSPIKIN